MAASGYCAGVVHAVAMYIALAVPAASIGRAVPMDCLMFDSFEPGRAPTAQMEQVRRLHNCMRRTAVPRPSPPLADLQWNATVAASAQSWANQCNFSHPGGHGYGENLAWGSGSYANTSVLTMLWINEHPYYNYPNNGCAAGQVCGHYTQIVWRNTLRFGCGTAQCGANLYLVCRYDPPGNYIGQRPY